MRGEVRLKLFGEGAESLRAFSVFDAGGRKLTLKSVRPVNQGAVATFVEKTLQGSVSPFVAWMAEKAEVSDDELAELEALVSKLQSQRREG